MILSTTSQIEGHTIREYKGIVTGETIIGANMFKDLFASIRDIVGGRAGAYEKVLMEANVGTRGQVPVTLHAHFPLHRCH